MAEKISINFHDIVGLDVLSDSKFVIDFYQNEYSSHLVQKLDEDTPRIKLYINQSSVPNISNHHYNTKHKLLARWNYIVQFSDNGIDIESTANHFGHIMLHHMVVHPCIRFLASNNNTLMLHAGAVTKNGGSIIITGKGGTGKTTTTSQLLAANPDISPHADDYVFLNTSNQSLAYITRSHLYSDLLKTIPGISERLTTREKIGVKVYSTIRKLSTDRIKWPTRVDQDRLWPNQDICKKAQIKAIIFLSRE